MYTIGPDGHGNVGPVVDEEERPGRPGDLKEVSTRLGELSGRRRLVTKLDRGRSGRDRGSHDIADGAGACERRVRHDD